jgi:hypothetical protein
VVDHDSLISVAISISVTILVDDHRLVPVGVMVPVFVDNDGFIAVAVSIGMDYYAAWPHTDTYFIGENKCCAANAGCRKENDRRTCHACCS